MAKTRSIIRRLPRYSAAVAATAAAGSTASGAVVVFNTPFSVNTPNTSVFWDINGDSTNDFKFIDYTHRTASSGVAKHIHLSALNNYGRLVCITSLGASNARHLRSMTAGALVGPTLPSGHEFQSNHALGFVTTGGGPYAFLGAAGSPQYIGFKFGDATHTYYGWANITINTQDVTVNSWAYENTSGTAIAVPSVAIPEPADAAVGLGLLAFGAAGVRAYRRRKQQAAA